jgi:hypothetical protein
MRRQKQLKKAFGVAEFGQIDYPVKTPNRRISQIVHYKRGEFIDSDYLNMFRTPERTWKCFRKTRWKSVR